MKLSRSLRHVVLAMTALSSFMLLGCGGCASHEQSSSTRASKSREPIKWELSPEAQITYSYLLYDQALRQEDEETLLSALDELTRYNPPVSVYVETGIWLMGRKSPLTLPVLERGVKRFPEDTSINLLYAEALQDSGQGALAVPHMESFIQRHPQNVDAKLELALLLVKTTRHKEAEQILNSLTGKSRTALVEYYHARALVGMNKQGEAVPHLQKAIKMMPDFVEAMAELAYIHETRNELKEARAVYDAMLRHNDAGQEVLMRLISLSLRLKQPQKAMEYYKKGPATTAFRATVASMLLEARQYTLAEPILENLVTMPDAPPDLYFYLAAVAYEGQKNLEKSLQWLDKIPPGDASYTRAQLLRMQLLIDAGKMEEALAIVRAGQKQDPEQKEFWSMEVRLLASLKIMDQAMEAANALLKRWPDDAEIAFLRASLLEENGDKAGALAAMEEIIKKHPDNFQALNYIGYTLAEENRNLPRALELLQKAAQLSPKSDYILDSLAWALFKAGRVEEAWKVISQAVELGTSPDPTIWEHYADIALALGKKAEARKGYYKALEFKPANADSLRERLSQL